MGKALFIIITLMNLNTDFSRKMLNDIVISKSDSSAVQSDSISKTLKSIELKQFNNKEELLKLEDQLSNIEESIRDFKKDIERLKPVKPGVFQEFIYPIITSIITSIIAAVIFWIAFSYIPERSRKKKIRFKIEYEIYQVYTRLFFLFDTTMSFNNHSPSSYQSEIRGNKLKSRDIELGLQNKCLNEHYFYDKVIEGRLLPIGKRLADIANEIDNSIRRIFDFNIYLTSDEILRLEEIRKRLYVYDLENYNSEAALKIGAIELYPVNPSISYMRNNLSELYELFKELQDSIFKNTLRNREIQIDTVQHYYYSEEYEKAIRAIEKGKNKYPKDINLFAFYEICSLFKLNKKDSAYRKIEKAFESKPHLVSSRDFINELLPDEKIKELLHKYFSEEDISKFQSVIETEQLQKVNFIKNAKELEGYYKQKSEKVHNES